MYSERRKSSLEKHCGVKIMCPFYGNRNTDCVVYRNNAGKWFCSINWTSTNLELRSWWQHGDPDNWRSLKSLFVRQSNIRWRYQCRNTFEPSAVTEYLLFSYFVRLSSKFTLSPLGFSWDSRWMFFGAHLHPPGQLVRPLTDQVFSSRFRELDGVHCHENR